MADAEKIYVIPQMGKRVLRPDTGQPLPPNGELVPNTTYWQRRAHDGDVVIAPRDFGQGGV